MNYRTIYMTEQTLTVLLEELQQAPPGRPLVHVTRVNGEHKVTIAEMEVDTSLESTVEKLSTGLFGRTAVVKL